MEKLMLIFILFSTYISPVSGFSESCPTGFIEFSDICIAWWACLLAAAGLVCILACCIACCRCCCSNSGRPVQNQVVQSPGVMVVNAPSSTSVAMQQQQHATQYNQAYNQQYAPSAPPVQYHHPHNQYHNQYAPPAYEYDKYSPPPPYYPGGYN